MKQLLIIQKYRYFNWHWQSFCSQLMPGKIVIVYC